MQYIRAPDSKYFVLKLSPHPRQKFVRDLEEAQVLEFDDEGTCLGDDDRRTVGLRRGAINEKVCKAVQQVVKNHASKFCSWAHDVRFDSYMKKLSIDAEDTEPFPQMRGRSETHLSEKDLDLRRRKMLHTRDHPDLANLVDMLYTVIDKDLRPAHLKDAPGADTRYPVTIGVCGTHIMAHSDEPEYDGPGAGIYNFIISGQGLAALSSWHTKEKWRVFEVNTGDVWWIADQFRFEWEHQVLRNMPTPVEVNFDDLSQQRIVVTVRMGKPSPEQLARWEEVYGSCYDDVDTKSTDKGKASPPTRPRKRRPQDDHNPGDGNIGEDHVHAQRTTGPAAPRTSKPYSATTKRAVWTLGDPSKRFKGHQAFQPYATLSRTNPDITFSPGMRAVHQSSTVATVLAVGTISTKTQPHYVCVLHFPIDDEVRPVLAHWLLAPEHGLTVTDGQMTKPMSTKLKKWMQTPEATIRLQNRPLRTARTNLTISTQEVADTTEPPAKKPRLSGRGSANKNKPVPTGDLGDLRQLMTSSTPGGVTRSSNKTGSNFIETMASSFGLLSSGLVEIGEHLRNINGGFSAEDMHERERQHQENIAALQKEKDDKYAALQKEKDDKYEKSNAERIAFLEQRFSNPSAPPTPTPTPPTLTPTHSTLPTLMSELKDLKQMLDDGIIDEEDWKLMKTTIIKGYK